MVTEHDSGYKLLFSHPEMVRDLLRDWVPGEWIHEADFSTLPDGRSNSPTFGHFKIPHPGERVTVQ